MNWIFSFHQTSPGRNITLEGLPGSEKTELESCIVFEENAQKSTNTAFTIQRVEVIIKYTVFFWGIQLQYGNIYAYAACSVCVRSKFLIISEQLISYLTCA